MHDCLIIGGGVVGLSIARELAGSGQRVAVVDRGRPGEEASWAGAGILPAASFRSSDHPLHRLAGLSVQLHAEWARELREETGIDNGYRQLGEYYVADGESDAELKQWLTEWRDLGLSPQELAPEDLAAREPQLAAWAAARERCSAVFLPGSGQVRNPRHLKALISACLARGVEFVSGSPVEDFVVAGGKIEAAMTNGGRITAGQFCLTAGAWSAGLTRCFQYSPRIRPVRGQIVLLRQPRATFDRVINQSLRYLVPREDGRVLVGATIEEVGFLKETTAAAIAGLIDLATTLVPTLAEAEVERTWSGLRPATADGLPYLGAIPGVSNGFVAAGHYRSGLQLSTGTGRVLRQQMLGESTTVDLAPFRVDRD